MGTCVTWIHFTRESNISELNVIDTRFVMSATKYYCKGLEKKGGISFNLRKDYCSDK